MDLANQPLAPVVPQDQTNLNPNADQPQPEDQFFGRLKFHLANGDTEGFADEHQLINDLRQVGYQPLGVSADGMTITLQGDQGSYEVSTPEVLQKMGWQVKGYQPLDVDHEHVSPELRFIIESPGIREDDHAKEAVIKSRLQRQGVKDPQVVGSGSDWYVFNPNTSQYIALTNKPGMDLGDLGEVGARAGGILASGTGAVVGTGLGPAGTVGGAVAGGQLGNRLTDAAAAALEPSYLGTIADRGLGENLKTIGLEAGTDALAGVGGLGLSKLGSAGASLVRNGLLSRFAQGAGGSAELSGKAIQGTADFLSKGTPRDVGVALADPTGVSLYGELAKLPQSALRGASRGVGKLGESEFLSKVAPEQAARMRDISARLLQRRATDSPTLGAKFAESIGRPTAGRQSQIGAEEVMGNLGDMVGMKIGRQRAAVEVAAHPGVIGDARAIEHDTLQDLLKQGMRYDAAEQAARQASQGFLHDWTEGLAKDAAPKLPGFSAVGRGVDNASKLGQMGVSAVGIPYDAAMGAARAGGRALNYGGRALRSAGEGMAPIETPSALKYGSEELMDRLRRRQAALQRQGYDRNIVPDTLADNSSY